MLRENSGAAVAGFGNAVFKLHAVRRLTTILVCLLIGAIGFWQGWAQYSANFTTALFYQSRFDPALSLACHGTYSRAEVTPKMHAFLAGETSAISCDLVNPLKDEPLVRFQKRNRSLLYLAAGSWWLLGTQWESLALVAGLFGAMFALGTLALAAACRVPLVLSAPLATAVMFAGRVELMLPMLRDFSKAPFILLCLALLAIITTRSLPVQRIRLLSAGLGAVIAIGNGFRTDVQVLLVVAPLVVYLVPTENGIWDHHKKFAGAVAGLAAGYVSLNLYRWLFADPHVVLTSHVAMFGFSERMLHTAGIVPGDYYPIMAGGDLYAWFQIALLKGSFIGTELALKSAAYAEAARDYFVGTVLTLPYDTALRALSVAEQLGAVVPMSGLGLLLFATAVWRWRIAAFILIAGGLLAAFVSLAFELRHTFHLIAIEAVIIGTGLTAMGNVVVGIYNGKGRSLARRSIKIATAGAFAAIILLAVLAIAGRVQDHNMAVMADKVRSLEWTAVEATLEGSEVVPKRSSILVKGKTLAEFFATHTILTNMKDKWAEDRLAEIALDSAATLGKLTLIPRSECTTDRLSAQLVYEAVPGQVSMHRTVDGACRKIEYHFPMIFSPVFSFSAVDLGEFASMYDVELAVADVVDVLPFELFLVDGVVGHSRAQTTLWDLAYRSLYR